MYMCCRCLGCSRAKRLYGPDRQAYVKVEYGEIIDRPLHHRRCEPLSEESVLVQNLDRECRRSIRKGEKNPREAHAEVCLICDLSFLITLETIL